MHVPLLSIAWSLPAARHPPLRLTLPKEIVVIGGGWAGYSAADALSADTSCHVTLLDASSAVGGLAGGWRTPGGRPIEAGIHGFWREYKNTFRVLESLGIQADEVLTPFTPSVLVSKAGKVATAPVLATDDDAGTAGAVPSPKALLELLRFSPLAGFQQLVAAAAPPARLLDLLPPPLDTALLADFASTRLTPLDRASAVGLAAAWADFDQSDAASWARYDQLSAETLFKKYGGVTNALYEELVAPLLHVLPMGPGYDLSAAAALSCFHVFALQSRGAFDVRWCRGSIAEKIFAPWQKKLLARGVTVQSSARVSTITRDGEEAAATPYATPYATPPSGRLVVRVEGSSELLLADAVVLAVGAVSAGRLADVSPVLGSLPAARKFRGLRGVTCVAVRLFLQPAAERTRQLSGGICDSTLLPPAVARAMADSPVLVVGPHVGGMSELVETGFCVYDLQRLHNEHADGELAVMEVDFYRADALAAIESDEALGALALRAAAAAMQLDPSVLDPSLLVDVAVVRARNAVSHFAVGSAALSPGVRLGSGVYCCGDWVDRSGHASWSTEKSVVTGRQVAAAVGRDLGLRAVDGAVIDPAPDAPPLQALRQIARAARASGTPLFLSEGEQLPRPAPWASLL